MWHPVDLAQPDHTPARGQPSTEPARALSGSAPGLACGSPQGGRWDATPCHPTCRSSSRGGSSRRPAARRGHVLVGPFRLKPEQIESRVRETPFASLAGLLPTDRAELYAFLVLFLTVIQLVMKLRTSDAPTMPPEQVREIIEQVEHDSRPQAPTVTPSVPLVTLSAHNCKY